MRRQRKDPIIPIPKDLDAALSARPLDHRAKAVLDALWTWFIPFGGHVFEHTFLLLALARSRTHLGALHSALPLNRQFIPAHFKVLERVWRALYQAGRIDRGTPVPMGAALHALRLTFAVARPNSAGRMGGYYRSVLQTGSHLRHLTGKYRQRPHIAERPNIELMFSAQIPTTHGTLRASINLGRDATCVPGYNLWFDIRVPDVDLDPTTTLELVRLMNRCNARILVSPENGYDTAGSAMYEIGFADVEAEAVARELIAVYGDGERLPPKDKDGAVAVARELLNSFMQRRHIPLVDLDFIPND